MDRERVISEVKTAEEAKKVEETVKTGYLEATIDTLVNWVGVEEDLVNSYEGLSNRAQTPAAKTAFKELSDGSKKNVVELTALQRSLEGLDRDRVQRIKLLVSLEP